MSQTINDRELIMLYEEMALIYPKINKPASADAAAQLRLIFAGFDYKELKDAFLAYSRKERYAPTPANLIDEAKANRYAAYMKNSASRLPSYVDGQRVYKCPYCQDTGYMQLFFPDDQHETLFATCVHTKPKAFAKLKKFGKFRFRYPKYGFDEIVAWNARQRLFQPEDSFVAGWSADSRLDATGLAAATESLFSLSYKD